MTVTNSYLKVLIAVDMYELGNLFFIINKPTTEQIAALRRMTAVTDEDGGGQDDLVMFDALNNRTGIFANAAPVNFNKELETKFDAVYAFNAPNIF